MKRVSMLTVCLVLCGYFLSFGAAAPKARSAVITIGDHSFNVELALTPSERRQGLMNRDTLPHTSGMLFVFPSDGVRSFWMKDTRIPLSIAFISADGVIVRIKNMKPFSLRPVSSDVPVRYALEVNQGLFEWTGIQEGQKVRLPDLTGYQVY